MTQMEMREERTFLSLREQGNGKMLSTTSEVMGLTKIMTSKKQL
jgi:hypothetical protein